MFYGKPVKVHKMSDHRWAVINPSGDAELGNWVICECFWEEHANNIAKLINLQLTQPMCEDLQKLATGEVVRIPTSISEAALMVGLGVNYLQVHAPEKLKI